MWNGCCEGSGIHDLRNLNAAERNSDINPVHVHELPVDPIMSVMPRPILPPIIAHTHHGHIQRKAASARCLPQDLFMQIFEVESLLTKAVTKESVVEDGICFVHRGDWDSHVGMSGLLAQISLSFSEYTGLQRATALLGDSNQRSRLQSIDVARCIHSQLAVTEGIKLCAGEEPRGDGNVRGPCGTWTLLRCASHWSS